MSTYAGTQKYSKYTDGRMKSYENIGYLEYLIFATSTQTNMSIYLEHRECHRDDIDGILRVLSYTIWSIIAIYDDIVYCLLFITIEYLLREE